MSKEKQNINKEGVFASLQMEYNNQRAEIRDLIKTMDTNLNMGVTFLGVIIAAYIAHTDKMEILYVIPSVIFVVFCMHMTKVASAAVHGTYCHAIEKRYKKLLGDGKNHKGALLDFEGGCAKFAGEAAYLTQRSIYGVIGFFLIVFIIAGVVIFSKWMETYHDGWLYNLFIFRNELLYWIILSYVAETLTMVWLLDGLLNSNPPAPLKKRLGLK